MNRVGQSGGMLLLLTLLSASLSALDLQTPVAYRSHAVVTLYNVLAALNWPRGAGAGRQVLPSGHDNSAGINPLPFHVANILLHAIVGTLVHR